MFNKHVPGISFLFKMLELMQKQKTKQKVISKTGLFLILLYCILYLYHFYLTVTPTTLTYTQEHSQKDQCQDRYQGPPSSVCSVYSFSITKQEIDSIMKIISIRRDLHQVKITLLIEKKIRKITKSMPSNHFKNHRKRQNIIPNTNT